jgi:hypothetical protein
MLSGLPQGSTLGPLVFNIFINYLCAKIHFSKFLLVADGLKIFRVIKSAEDCKLFQSDIDSVQKCCTENYMKINTLQTNTISFTCKTNGIHFDYYVGDLLIIRTEGVKDLGVMLDNKPHFHRHVDYLNSRSLKMLVLIRFIKYNVSSLDSLKVVYTRMILIRSVHEGAPVA